jgi:hypothetical protein
MKKLIVLLFLVFILSGCESVSGNGEGNFKAMQIAKDRTLEMREGQISYFKTMISDFGYIPEFTTDWTASWSGIGIYKVIYTPKLVVVNGDTSTDIGEIMGFFKEACPEGQAIFTVWVGSETVRPENQCAKVFIK